MFAEQYDIQPLKALAVHQLHGTLAAFTLYHNPIWDIVTLLRYSYARTAGLEVRYRTAKGIADATGRERTGNTDQSRWVQGHFR